MPMTSSLAEASARVVDMLDSGMRKNSEDKSLKMVHFQVQDYGGSSTNRDHIALVPSQDLKNIVCGAQAVEAWFPMKVSDSGMLSPELCYQVYIPCTNRFLRVVAYRDPVSKAYIEAVYTQMYHECPRSADAFLHAFGLQHSWENRDYEQFRSSTGVKHEQE